MLHDGAPAEVGHAMSNNPRSPTPDNGVLIHIVKTSVLRGRVLSTHGQHGRLHVVAPADAARLVALGACVASGGVWHPGHAGVF